MKLIAALLLSLSLSSCLTTRDPDTGEKWVRVDAYVRIATFAFIAPTYAVQVAAEAVLESRASEQQLSKE